MGFAATFTPETFGRAAVEREVRLKRLRRLAWFLDAAFALPFTRFRFGMNGIAGLAPAVGDALMALISLYIVNEARLMGVPGPMLARMVRNVAIEAIGGAVPVVGDLFDVAFKANLRNLALIESHFGVELRSRKRGFGPKGVAWRP